MLNARELATVLAALRWIQGCYLAGGDDKISLHAMPHFDEVTRLSVGEINDQRGCQIDWDVFFPR